MTDKFERLIRAVRGTDASGIVAEVYGLFENEKVVVASSGSYEDQLLTHYACAVSDNPRVFTLDTGRLFEETYRTLDNTMSRYGFRYEVLVPDTTELERFLCERGPDSFYKGIADRKECCRIRKTAPLKRMLATAEVWICGLRREQAVTRADVNPVEWDAVHDIIKVNPLFDWNEQDVIKAVHENNIPYNTLQDAGFRSIGCSPCTRALRDGEDLRAGRWWWEEPEHKECGLHTGRNKRQEKNEHGSS